MLLMQFWSKLLNIFSEIDNNIEGPNIDLRVGALGYPQFVWDWYVARKSVVVMSMPDGLCVQRFVPGFTYIDCNVLFFLWYSEM